MVEYEFWDLSFGREEPRTEVTQLLTTAAECHGWVLDRVCHRPSGERTVRLRRSIMRLRSTL